MDPWVIVVVCGLGVVAVGLLAGEAQRLFFAWGRFAKSIAASRPGAVVVLVQMRPDLPRQLRMLTGDHGFADAGRDDTGAALVVDAATVELYRDPSRRPEFSCPTGDLVAASRAEHTVMSTRTGQVLRTYPALRLTLRGLEATGDLDLVPIRGPRLAFLAAKPDQIDRTAAELRRVAGPHDAAAS